MGVRRQVALFQLAAGVVFGLVGVVALVVGGVLYASQAWPSAVGTVGACVAVPAVDGDARSTTQRCEVSWMDGDRSRTTEIDLDRVDAVPGTEITIRYRGGTAVVETAPWVGYATLAVGVLLVAAGGWVAFRAWRPPA